MSTNDRKSKIENIIALNTERHKLLQEMEDFEAYYRANIQQTLDEIVLQVASERARETSAAGAHGQASRKSTTISDFFARFYGGAYQALMEAMYPIIAGPVAAGAMQRGTRSGTAEADPTDPTTPQQEPSPVTLTPEQDALLQDLPTWVVVPIAHMQDESGYSFAILRKDGGEAGARPKLDLRVNGETQTDRRLAVVKEDTAVPGAPGGRATRVTLVRPPSGCEITEREDGTLVLDFTMP